MQHSQGIELNIIARFEVLENNEGRQLGNVIIFIAYDIYTDKKRTTDISTMLLVIAI